MRARNGLLLILAALIALALPGLAAGKGPASRITIVGPGLGGEVEIVNDAVLLEALSMTMLEDFSQPIDPPAHPALGFELTRFFEANSREYIPFDVVVYTPGPEGEPGTIYYDGIVNGSSEYDGRWFRAKPEGEGALRAVLAAHGANFDATTTVTAPYLVLSGEGSRLRLIDPATLDPAGEWQAIDQDFTVVSVTAGPGGDNLFLAATGIDGSVEMLQLNLRDARACLHNVPGQAIAMVRDGESVIVAGWQDNPAGSAPSAVLEVRRADTLDLTAVIPVPGEHRAAQHSPSVDGRWIVTLHHGADETWLGVFDTYARRYTTDRKLGALVGGAIYRVAWDTTGEKVYVIDGQRVYRFSTTSLEFIPYRGFALVDQDRMPLGEPGVAFEIAGAHDGTLYLYRSAEGGGPAGIGGIYVVRAVLGQMSQHLWSDLPLTQAILHGGTIYALEAPNAAGDAALWALDPQTGARQRATTLRKGEEHFNLAWLDPAALPGAEQQAIISGTMSACE